MYKNEKEQLITPQYRASKESSPYGLLTSKLNINSKAQKTMRRICELGSVLAVEIPDALQEWNEENDAERARLSFAYASNASDLSDGEDETARLLLAQHTNGQRYSIMVDLASVEGKDTETKRAWFESQLKGKKVTFTTFVADVAELLAGTDYDGETLVKNDTREYRTLSDSFLGKNTDESGALTRLRARLLQQLEDGTLETGSTTNNQNQNRNNRRR